MFTMLKLTVANIKKKKFRTILISLSIVLSVALMYTVLSLSSSITKIFEQQIKKEVGSAELLISTKDNSGEESLSELDFEGIEGISYSIPLVTAYGYSKLDNNMVPIAFSGMSVEDYDTVYDLNYIEKTSESLSKNQVLIGRKSAEVYELTLGDELKVNLGGKEHKFLISGILEDQNNNLGYSSNRLSLIVDKDTLSEIMGMKDKVSAYFIQSLPKVGKISLMATLEKSFPTQDIKNITDMGDYKQYISMIVTSLLLMVSAVILVSAFIIYSSFKMIAIERMPLMGTLRSIGATRRMTVRTLLYEALFYGLIGGILGNALGVGILSITMKMLLQGFGIRVEDISYFNTKYILVALLIGFVLAIGSAMIPILKMSKKSIRSIIFSEIKNEKHLSLYKTMIGLVLVVAAFILFSFAPLELKLTLDILGMLLVTIGGALIVPMISNIFSRVLSILLRPIYKDGLKIVSSNIKNDGTMMNNIMLLAMGLGIILMINNFSSTVGSAVSDLYATGKSDALVMTEMDQDFVKNVAKVEGVEHVYTTKEVVNLTANDGKIDLLYLEGIDGRGYSEYAWDEFGKYLTDDLLAKFTGKRSIIISKFTANKYDLHQGESLEIDFGGHTVGYEIIGIVSSLMNNGNESFISEEFLTKDSGNENYQGMYLNIKDNTDMENVLQKIKELMPYSFLPIQTLDEMRDQNMQSNDAVFFMMKAISLIAMFIGVVGILNNFTISFLSRRKLIATMRSLGLSKKKTVHTMLLEAFFCGCLGTLSGLILGSVFLKAMCYMIEAMGIPSEVIYYSMKDYVFVLISGILLSLLSAILPAISIAKENIVSGLRCE